MSGDSGRFFALPLTAITVTPLLLTVATTQATDS